MKHIPQGFIGMNVHAARSHHIPYPHPKKTVTVLNSLKGKSRKQTIKHEKIEYTLMKPKKKGKRGMSYKKAHKIALKLEKQ